MCVFENDLTRRTQLYSIPQKVSKSSVGQSPHVNTVDIGLFNQTSLSIIKEKCIQCQYM